MVLNMDGNTRHRNLLCKSSTIAIDIVTLRLSRYKHVVDGIRVLEQKAGTKDSIDLTVPSRTN